jgi:predicted  nucleic acid-binding Zn-ribbon protein
MGILFSSIGGWFLKKALTTSLSRSLAEVVIYQNNLMFAKIDLYQKLYEHLNKDVTALKDKYEGLETRAFKNREDIDRIIKQIQDLK